MRLGAEDRFPQEAPPPDKLIMPLKGLIIRAIAYEHCVQSFGLKSCVNPGI